jgi:hypothetical protein
MVSIRHSVAVGFVPPKKKEKEQVIWLGSASFLPL